MKKLAKNNKGFSLVELIVVIAIMAVLVGVLAPQLIKYVEKSRQATYIQNCDSIATTLKTYFSDKEGLSGAVTVTVSDGTTAIAYATAADASGATASSTLVSEATTALTDAGLNSTNLKGSQWDNDSIAITYDCSNGKITYTANSDNYNATNNEEIKPGKATTNNNQNNNQQQQGS